MSMIETEFPVGGLLNGDSYKTPTRMKNISAAMTWIQKQMESLRDSDKQLLNLFHKLETDMAELKSIYYDGSRGRTSSVSSIKDFYSKSSQGSINPIEESSPILNSRVRILEEMTATLLTHSDSEESLAGFADELGLDELEDDYEDDHLPSISGGRPSIRSQSSGISTGQDINFTLSLPSTQSLPEEEEHPILDSFNISRYTSSNSQNSPRLLHSSEKKDGRRLSNDSGAVADNESTGSSASGETSGPSQEHSNENSLTATLKEVDSSGLDKRLSGFADEIFAMFKDELKL